MTEKLLSGKQIALETHNSSRHDGGVALYLPDQDKVVAIQAERIDRKKHSGDSNAAYQYAKSLYESQGYIFGTETDKFDPNLQKEQPIHHHLAHAASAFYPSGFESAAVLVVDGQGAYKDGAYNSTTIWKGSDRQLELVEMNPEPDFSTQSIGQFYSAITYFLGLGYLEEGKTMGLAPYGKSSDTYRWLKQYVKTSSDGSYEIVPGFTKALFWASSMNRTAWGEKTLLESRMLDEVNGYLGESRKKEEPLTQKFIDLAWASQAVFEDVIVGLVGRAKALTGEDHLCMSGGVALNSVANMKVVEAGVFSKIFFQAAAGDEGQALGKLMYRLHSEYQLPRTFTMKNAYLGPEYENQMTVDALNRHKDSLQWTKLEREDLYEKTATSISECKIIGWFQGRSEIGPRALGNRSILADPRRPDMRDHINFKVKHREWFRPLAPSAILDRADEFFDLRAESPFMIVVCNVKPDKRALIPAVTHIDGTARIQTVTREENEKYYDVIKKFGELTGVPLLLNTSFNDAGKPIVETPEDAIAAFLGMNLDYLVIGDYFINKKSALI